MQNTWNSLHTLTGITVPLPPKKFLDNPNLCLFKWKFITYKDFYHKNFLSSIKWMHETCKLYASSYPQVTSSWEVFSVLVKWDCHDSVSGVECFLHTVTMMNVNVHVQHSLVVPDHSHCFYWEKIYTNRPTQNEHLITNGEWRIVDWNS